MTTHRFELFADYFQFYLRDESADGNLGDSWTPEAVNRLLALAPGTIGVGTVRDMTVPVVVEIRGEEPTDDFSLWDHVAQCSIDVSSGLIVVAGCTDYFPDAARIHVEPGCYCARVYYGGLDTLSPDGLDGKDHYEIILWPAPPGEPCVLKQWHGAKERFQAI